jgi:cell wall-associated NlpC family hydrolase
MAASAWVADRLEHNGNVQYTQSTPRASLKRQTLGFGDKLVTAWPMAAPAGASRATARMEPGSAAQQANSGSLRAADAEIEASGISGKLGQPKSYGGTGRCFDRSGLSLAGRAAE